jgi:hypothetical protein
MTTAYLNTIQNYSKFNKKKVVKSIVKQLIYCASIGQTVSTRVIQFLNTYVGFEGFALHCAPYSTPNLQVNPIIGTDYRARSAQSVAISSLPTPVNPIPYFSQSESTRSHQIHYKYENFFPTLTDFDVACSLTSAMVSNLNGCAIVVAKLSKGIGLVYKNFLFSLSLSYEIE